MSFFQETLGGLRKLFAPRPSGVVLALGGGGAAGLAHIGVLQTLAENNIPVRAIAGTSIGAEIGAFYATGVPLDELAAIAIAFDWKQTLRLFLPDLPSGGLVSGVRITDFLRDRLGDRRIEDLAVGYVALAADLDTGEQVVLDRGDLVEAVRASVSLPGLLAPLRLAGRTLVDGGVLNPLPFDVARQYFGGPVVAVATHAAARGVMPKVPSAPQTRQWLSRARQLLDQPWVARAPALQAWLRAQLGDPGATRNAKTGWTARRVFDRAIDMTQAEIVRLRRAQQPPDLLLTPLVGDVGLLEFYRATEAIAAGRRAAEEKLPEIRQLVGAASRARSATAGNIGS